MFHAVVLVVLAALFCQVHCECIKSFIEVGSRSNQEISSLDEVDYEELLNEDDDSWKKIFYRYFIARLTTIGRYKGVMLPRNKELKSLRDEIASNLRSIKDYSGKGAVKDLVHKSSKVNADGSLELVFHFIVDSISLEIEMLDMTRFQNVRLDAKYQMTIEDNSACLEEQVPDGNGGTTVWTSEIVGSVQYKTNLTSWRVTMRSCKFDEVTDMPKWDAPRVWQMIHEPCSEFDEYVNNITHKDILGPSIEYNQQHQLQKFTESPVDAKTLGEVARLTSREIRAAKELTTEMHDDLRKILAALQTNGQAVVIQEPRVNFVVADLDKKSQAVNGFTMIFQETGLGQVVEPILLGVNRKASPNKVNPRPTVSLTVSNDIVGVANKIAFAAVWSPRLILEDDTVTQLALEVDVILVGPKVGAFSDKSFIDIAYQLNEASGATNISCRFVPDDLYTTFYFDSDDLSHDCDYLGSATKSEILCRCPTKYFTAKDGAVFSGTFTLKENKPKDFESDNKNLGLDTSYNYLDSLDDKNYDHVDPLEGNNYDY